MCCVCVRECVRLCLFGQGIVKLLIFMVECLSVDSEFDCRHGVQDMKNLILAERFLLELLCLTKDVKVVLSPRPFYLFDLT